MTSPGRSRVTKTSEEQRSRGAPLVNSIPDRVRESLPPVASSCWGAPWPSRAPRVSAQRGGTLGGVSLKQGTRATQKTESPRRGPGEGARRRARGTVRGGGPGWDGAQDGHRGDRGKSCPGGGAVRWLIVSRPPGRRGSDRGGWRAVRSRPSGGDAQLPEGTGPGEARAVLRSPGGARLPPEAPSAPEGQGDRDARVGEG
jgi:hypothetical protein